MTLGLKKSLWRQIQDILRTASKQSGQQKLLTLALIFPLKLRVDLEDLPRINPAIREAVEAAAREVAEEVAAARGERTLFWDEWLRPQIVERGGEVAAAELKRKLEAAIKAKRAMASVSPDTARSFMAMVQ